MYLISFFLDKKGDKKSRLAWFRYLYLTIPKQNGTRFAQTTFCFNGIFCIKLPAEQREAVLIRVTAIHQ